METESGLIMSGTQKISSVRFTWRSSLTALETKELFESAEALLALTKGVGSSKKGIL